MQNLDAICSFFRSDIVLLSADLLLKLVLCASRVVYPQTFSKLTLLQAVQQKVLNSSQILRIATPLI